MQLELFKSETIFDRTSSIRIPISFKPHGFYSQIIHTLTRREKSYQDPTQYETKYYYDETSTHLLIPRFYPIENYGYKVNTIVTEGKNIDIEFVSQFRNQQQKTASDFLVSHDSGILCMLPGEGKTVVTISGICRLKKKAIIFVHKDSLATQWYERFKQHSNIKDENICFLSTKTYTDLLTKDVIICTVQTFGSMLKRIPELYDIMIKADFGISIWDESHIAAGAESFSKTCLYTPAKKVFGLSATPKRSDGNDDVINMNLGSVYRPDGASSTMAPKVIAMKFDCRAVGIHRKYIYMRRMPDKKIFFKFEKSKYLSMLTTKKNIYYIRVMRSIVKNVHSANRKVILLADRIDILDLCSSVLPKDDYGFFLPREKEKQDSALDKKFVFSTYGSARDGTDKDTLDCLIMATTTSNWEQAIGRICRPVVGKPQPVVIDIVDIGCPEMVQAYEKRKEFYLQKGWTLVEKTPDVNK